MWNLPLISILVLVATITFVEANAQTDDEKPQYILRVRTDPNILYIGGGGLYDQGTTVKIDSVPGVWREYTFLGWKIDDVWSDDNPPSIRMDRNHEVVAIFEKSLSGKIIVDTIPRIGEVVVDGTIYLPSELPISFDWDTGSEHSISVPDSVKESLNTRYVFDSWKNQNPANSITVVVDSDDSEFIALFKVQHYLKLISEYGDVVGGGWQDEGSTVNIDVESDIVIDKKNENVRYIFDSWSHGDYQNSPSNSIDLENPNTVKASWEKQYFLQLKTNVPGYDLYGTGWYDIGKQVSLIAEKELESPNANVKYAFERWVSKGPNPVTIPNAQRESTTIIVEEPYVIEVQYAKSFRVNVWTQFGEVNGDGFYKDGTVAELKVTKPQVEVQAKKIRKVFTGWNTYGAKTMNLGDNSDVDLSDLGIVGNSNLLLFVDRPTNVTTNWKTQYYLDVQSSESKPKGSGWYDLGRLVPISVASDSTPPGMWSMNKFDRWVGDIDSTKVKERVIMNGPKTVIAEWREDNTPGIINSIILGGIVVVSVVVFTKTRKNQLYASLKKKSNIEEIKPFEKFFSTRKHPKDSDSTPSFIQKKTKGQSIVDWLFGR